MIEQKSNFPSTAPTNKKKSKSNPAKKSTAIPLSGHAHPNKKQTISTPHVEDDQWRHEAQTVGLDFEVREL